MKHRPTTPARHDRTRASVLVCIGAVLALLCACNSDRAVEEEEVDVCDVHVSDGRLCSDGSSTPDAEAPSLSCKEIVQKGAEIFNRAKRCERDEDCVLKAVAFPMICQPGIELDALYTYCDFIAVNRDADFEDLSDLRLAFYAPKFWEPEVDPCVREAFCGNVGCSYETPFCDGGHCRVEWRLTD